MALEPLSKTDEGDGERVVGADDRSFTILHSELNEERDDTRIFHSIPPGKSVNIVKPLQRDKDRLNIPEMEPPSGPQTMLDPKFTRALDFKLRRLKEKEVIKENLSRRPRFRQNRNLGNSNPNVDQEQRISKKLSKSQPSIDLPDVVDEKSPRRHKHSPHRISKRNAVEIPERPRFVTTVKTGKFLLPPPDLASLLGLESLYPEEERVFSYCNKPKAVQCRPRGAAEKKKQEQIEDGAEEVIAEFRQQKRPCAKTMFGGMRSLVAGIVGLKSNFRQRHKNDNKNEDTIGSDTAAPYANMMHDRRVIRGSNFAQPPLGAGAGDADGMAARAARSRKRALARKLAAARLRPGTPPPAPGRRHHPIQTEYYLEELFDKGVEMEVGVQTDLFLNRPLSPLYVPAKTGMDVATQIYPGELFDFDLEVQPILEVLVGKTVEQALTEVAQEEELATLKEQQRRFNELRDAERAERQRLEEQDRRLEAEKERRVAEAQHARANAIETKERAAAATMIQGYIADLLPRVVENLRDQGYLLEKIERSVEDEFMAWLRVAVCSEVEAIITSRDVITEIVREVVEARAEQYRATGEREAELAALPTPSESSTEPSVHEEMEEETEDDEGDDDV